MMDIVALFPLLALFSVSCEANQPNIVLIVADDYGWNDIGYHGSEIKTPTLDLLASEGIKLENYYVQPICTPSRSQLLTGRYQIHTGLQHLVILPCVPSGLPLEDKTLADKLKEAGYKTHLVGKWHLGLFKEEYYPTRRGFDSHFGFLLGEVDYYSHERSFMTFNGYDFRQDMNVYTDAKGTYSTHIFTQRAQQIIKSHDSSKPLFLMQAFQSVHTPLQVPEHYTKPYTFIKDENRRNFAGMVSAMDEGIRNITDTLKATGLWDNTILIFTTDNGAQIHDGGDNSPLRGNKMTNFEGGIRGVGFVSGPQVAKRKGAVSRQLLHISDWFPTLINVAGGSLNGTKPDGYDQWETILNGSPSRRQDILINIDPEWRRKGVSVSPIFDTSVQAGLRYGDWKLLTGDPGFDKWAPDPKLKSGKPEEYFRQASTEPQNVYLFNITADPTERNEVSEQYPEVVEQLLGIMAKYNSTAVPVNFPLIDPKCAPMLNDGNWGAWE